MKLSDLSAGKRRERVLDAINGALRQAKAPMPTTELVKRVEVLLGTGREETVMIARIAVDLSKHHPLARETGETFVKYGRTMKRWEWLPAPRTRRRPSDAELDRRREIVQADAEADEWTWTPEEYLDD